MKKEHRGAFKSNFGVMMAVAGSAVGLGNIWRFPFLAGQNGGAAFLLIYVALVLIVGLPLVLGEFAIGRATHRSVVGSFRKLAPGKAWVGIGYLSVIIGFVLMGFYSVVAGWTIRFVVEAVSNNFAGQSPAEITASFNTFTASIWQPMLYSTLFVGLAAYVVSKGVEHGIEKFNKILMPTLVAILILLCINSMTLDGWSEGMNFLFNPDFSKITTTTILEALGQVFFTLSVGMGVMITYSSYVTKEENMPRSKGIVALIDTSIAIIAGIAIFPAVFTFGIAPSEGPSLVFLTLPNVFAQIPFGYVVAIIFFVMLFIAAITSAISIMEMIVAFFIEEFRLQRRKAVVYTSVAIAVLGIMCASSSYVFNLFDTLSANYLLPSGGFLIALFVGWFFNRKLLRQTFTSNGRYANALFPLFMFFIRYVVPVAVAFIFLSKIGVV